jgi:two-component system response regulator RpaA
MVGKTKKRKPERDLFTCGEIAEMIGVVPRTVAKWIDDGRLRGFRLPGSQHRRARRDDVEKFCVEHGIDLK